MAKEKLLLVDDDKNIVEILAFNLKNEGFKVVSVESAEDALKLPLNEFQIILLDVMMGGMSGYKMAEKLRQDGIAVPIIFLTAKDTENDMLTGFSVGGDDYISKPFSIKEVIARVRAVLKRTNYAQNSEQTNDSLEFGDFLVDLNLKELYIKSKKIILTKTEFEILILFVTKPKQLFSREQIIDKIWADTPFITKRTVDVHIARLRKKLGDSGDVIVNRSGYGYHFNTDVL